MKLAQRAQLITVAGLLSTALLLILGTGANHRTLLRQQLLSSLASQATTQASLIRSRLDATEQLLRGLAAGPALQRYLVTGNATELADRFLVLAANHPQLLQVRYLDTDGMEQVRVDRTDGRANLIPREDLQDKSSRDYVARGKLLAPGELWLTEMEPNREHGEIERPLKPTMRLIMALFDATGGRRGMLVLNLDGHAILPPARIGTLSLRIAEPDGTYVLHPDPTQAFGRALGTGTGTRQEFGLNPARLDLPHDDLELDSQGTEAGAPLLGIYQWLDLGSAHQQRWLLLATQPEGVLVSILYKDLGTLVAATVLVALLASLLIWLALRQVARRLDRITEAARQITAGRRDVVVDTDGQDGVAILGRAFNGMTRELAQALDQEQKIRAQLEEANVELHRSNDDLESFARAAAHDLKTPLRALRILPTFIAEDLEEAGDLLAQHLQEMTTQATRLEDLVDALLKYSLLGKEKSAPETFAPAPVIERIGRTIPLPDGFELRLDIDLPSITCVPVEFEIVIRNLMQNAIRHHDRDHGIITVRIRASTAQVILEVEDDGPGVPDAMKDRVLLPLRTGKSKDMGAGTGLGLAFVSKIADRRDGSVRLLDAPERGLIVQLALPREKELAPPLSDDAPDLPLPALANLAGLGSPGAVAPPGPI